ncbi:MAG: class I SAM-dependent methyltransferase [Alphaproteobacteria bacterium]|nr:class I SAM-dependent methyltransferase [Alphaproteobacteria bacterium]
MTNSDQLLDDQIAYYAARAGEYDQWFLRQGRYDRGPTDNADWFNEVEEVRAALNAFAPRGDILEIAPGTGLWTEKLLTHAASVTAVDANQEVLNINKARCRSDRVRYIQANIFEWQPDRVYDVVFFGFWLSHVPPDRLGSFIEWVRAALKPGGRFFFVDSKRETASTARDNILPGEGSFIARRSLNDGRTFDIVKVFYLPDDLAKKLERQGLQVAIRETARFFIYGRTGDADVTCSRLVGRSELK